MMTYRHIVVVLLILFFLIGYTNGLTCFSCKDCGDPFDTTRNETETVEVTNGTNLFCRKTKGASIVDRNLTTECVPLTAVGNGVWCCQTDLCNHANIINSFGIISLVSFILVKLI